MLYQYLTEKEIEKALSSPIKFPSPEPAEHSCGWRFLEGPDKGKVCGKKFWTTAKNAKHCKTCRILANRWFAQRNERRKEKRQRAREGDI